MHTIFCVLFNNQEQSGKGCFVCRYVEAVGQVSEMLTAYNTRFLSDLCSLQEFLVAFLANVRYMLSSSVRLSVCRL